ncbi:hypothetical protein Ndes2526B_g01584 [Nannochloris sp. 'desiccata']|nr:hypothetical protein KSW81_005911 [Chlorella desiccata (nom. nud.)]KAH7623167.1 putative Medium chain reductase/dehydrogenase ucsI [Chlorella desiccata (nom. nud.)]
MSDHLMRALVFRGRCCIALETVPIPTIQDPTDVIVRISLTAVCGSDLHPYYGREVGLDHGTICGHEFVGTIYQLGSTIKENSTFEINQRVMSPFTCSCGGCFYCSRGLTARCVHSQLFGWREQGKGLHGAQAQFIRVPMAASTLVPIPDDLTDENALLLGDILSTGYFCADNAEISEYPKIKHIDNSVENEGPIVAVVGCGPVGLISVAAARYLGAKTVIAVDSISERLALAEAHYGAKTINISSSEEESTEINAAVVALVHSMTDGRGADCVLEAVGLPAAFTLACELVRPGGVVSVAGCHSDAVAPMHVIYNKNMTIKSGRCSARHFMDILLPLLKQSAAKYKSESENGDESGSDGNEKTFIDLTPIITHRLPLTPEAYILFDSKKDGVVKIVMNPWLDS